MKPSNVVNRFLLPLVLVIGCQHVSAFIYHNAGPMPPGFFRTTLIKGQEWVYRVVHHYAEHILN